VGCDRAVPVKLRVAEQSRAEREGRAGGAGRAAGPGEPGSDEDAAPRAGGGPDGGADVVDDEEDADEDEDEGARGVKFCRCVNAHRLVSTAESITFTSLQPGSTPGLAVRCGRLAAYLGRVWAGGPQARCFLSCMLRSASR